jgi:dihydrofolate reductase
MTNHERPSFTLSDTTFHFVGGDPTTVLKLALEAADGKDVRLGGGANTVRQFLDAGLIDTLHVAVAPVELGGGSRLWGSPEELLDRYHTEVIARPNGVAHHLFWRD